MTSGLFQRLQAPPTQLKMYGFKTVDREREKTIVARLTRRPGSAASAAATADTADAASAAAAATSAATDSAGAAPPRCEKYPQRLQDDDDDRDRPLRLVADEAYSREVFRRLGRSHTFSSRCKQRELDPHRLCSGEAGEPPDYQPILDLNEDKPSLLLPSTPPPPRQQQPQPSLAMVAGFGRFASRASQAVAARRSQERRVEAAKQRASPFGLVFRGGGGGGGGTEEKPAASAAVFGALGRLRYRAKRDELQQRERTERARELRSDWEVVNATEFVRNYERRNRRGMRLAVLGRPTIASRFKAAASSASGVTACPFCREMPELAADWQRRLALAGDGADGECARCGRFHHGAAARPASAAAAAAVATEAADEEEAEAGADAAAAAAAAEVGGGGGDDNWGLEEETVLVARLRAPTRASEGGVPFCQRGQRAAGPGLGAALLGFEAQRPKSAIERVASAQRRRELIDAASVRLHSGQQSCNR